MKVPGTIFLLAIPIALMEFLADSRPPGRLLSQRGFGGWSVLPYLAIFVLGFLLAGGKEMAKARRAIARRGSRRGRSHSASPISWSR